MIQDVLEECIQFMNKLYYKNLMHRNKQNRGGYLKCFLTALFLYSKCPTVQIISVALRKRVGATAAAAILNLIDPKIRQASSLYHYNSSRCIIDGVFDFSG